MSIKLHPCWQTTTTLYSTRIAPASVLLLSTAAELAFYTPPPRLIFSFSFSQLSEFFSLLPRQTDVCHITKGSIPLWERISHGCQPQPWSSPCPDPFPTAHHAATSLEHYQKKLTVFFNWPWCLGFFTSAKENFSALAQTSLTRPNCSPYGCDGWGGTYDLHLRWKVKSLAWDKDIFKQWSGVHLTSLLRHLHQKEHGCGPCLAVFKQNLKCAWLSLGSKA